MIGEVYGMLTIIRHDNHLEVVCKCRCGKTKTLSYSSLRRVNKKPKSCGCIATESAVKTHGLSKSKEYASWSAMKNRCYYEKNIQFKDWGGRGITVCDRWLGEDGFINFYTDMGPKPTQRHSIDRKDNDKGYSPENCRWATMTEQCQNRKTSRIILDLSSGIYYESIKVACYSKGFSQSSLHRMLTGQSKNTSNLSYV